MSSSHRAFVSRTAVGLLLSAAICVAGCPGSPTPADASEAATDIVRDVPMAVDCQSLCTAANTQCPSIDATACATVCEHGVSAPDGGAVVDGGAAADVRGCLSSMGTCEMVAACLRGPASAPFSSGPYGTNPRDIAGPFTLETSDGTWTFQTEWTGDDSYVFLVYAPGVLSGGGADYSADLFASTSIVDLVAKSPPNVHYFFLPYRAADQAGLTSFRDTALADLAALDASVQAHWRSRLHFGTAPVMGMSGWIPTLLRSRSQGQYLPYGAVQFAIDRFQRIREVGQLGVLSSSGTATDLSFAANEPIYYNFEWERERSLRAHPATVVTLLTDQTTLTNSAGGGDALSDNLYADGMLPDAATMATFDTLEVDLSLNCTDHTDDHCGAWDYISDLRLCSAPAGGSDGGTDDANSGDATIDSGPPTPVCTTEIARWITSYWREGRWVTDISGMLPFLQAGGRQTFRWYAQHQWSPRAVPYVVSLSLRFSNQGRGMRPVAALPLWSQGGALNSMYDAAHPPVTFDVPAGTRRVEIYSLITGHGSETGQCAEFCNHTHHFSVNGAADHTLAFPEAQSRDGCANRVNEGVVPNQFGTWYFGRGGWCPGSDVRPFIADVTSQIHIGATNTASYHALINTTAPVAGRGYGNIDLSSYVVFWQ